MRFLVRGEDYSDHVIAGTYAVNAQDEYKSWQDANGTTHRDTIRSKVVGSFDMYFKSAFEVEQFVSLLHGRQSEGVDLTVSVNGMGEHQSIFFVDYELVRNRDYKWQDVFEVFTVNIEER